VGRGSDVPYKFVMKVMEKEFLQLSHICDEGYEMTSTMHGQRYGLINEEYPQGYEDNGSYGKEKILNDEYGEEMERTIQTLYA
jgi:hypothetical protein